MERSTRLLPLELRVFRTWKEKLSGSRVLVACSGGMDSVALSACFVRLAERIGFEVALAHVHHGRSANPSLRRFRVEALELVRTLGQEWDVEVLTAGGESNDPLTRPLESEQDLREFRLSALENLAESGEFSHVAFAHHSNDLLETRLIRLVRGTGPQGLEAMRSARGRLLRPFLEEDRSEILAYARQKKLRWVDDPSNDDVSYLRNWMRREWLPALEAKRSGAVRSLARSLELIANLCERPIQENLHAKVVIDRKAFAKLPLVEQKQTLASSLLDLGSKRFSASHVTEILKRLKNPRKTFEFEVSDVRWIVNAGQIHAVCVK